MQGRDIVNEDIQKRILMEVENRLVMAIKNEEINPKSSHIWLNIIAILDLFNRNDFYGEVSFKVRGNFCENIKIKEMTIKTDVDYADLIKDVGYDKNR